MTDKVRVLRTDRRLRIVEITRRSKGAGFNGGGHAQDLAEDDLRQPSHESRRVPISRADADFHVVKGRCAAQAQFGGVGRIVARAGAKRRPSFYLGLETAAVEGVGDLHVAVHVHGDDGAAGGVLSMGRGGVRIAVLG